jgi:NADPH:quinone reductase-like Zn-dependent oxidoreductase
VADHRRAGLIRPRSPVLGTELAGVAEAVSSSVASLGVGDRVFGYNEGPFDAPAEPTGSAPGERRSASYGR